jgi:hypothetical protein
MDISETILSGNNKLGWCSKVLLNPLKVTRISGDGQTMFLGC